MELTKTIEPRPCAFIEGTISCVSRRAPNRFTSKMRRQSSRSACSTRPTGLLRKALCTSTSMRPNSARAASARPWQSSGRVTSVGTASARRPLARTADGHLLELSGGARRQHDVGALARARERDLRRRGRVRCRRRGDPIGEQRVMIAGAASLRRRRRRSGRSARRMSAVRKRTPQWVTPMRVSSRSEAAMASPEPDREFGPRSKAGLPR